MPKGGKTYSRGGQRRTSICPCGHVIAGHPTQIAIRLRLHGNFCDQMVKDVKIPVFNTELAKTNGWNGISDNKIVTDKTVTVTLEGKVVGIMKQSVYEAALKEEEEEEEEE